MLTLLLPPHSARAADPDASITYFDPALVDFAARLSSELASQGYGVRVGVLSHEPACDAPTPPVAEIAGAVSVQLGVDRRQAGNICAVIGYAAEDAIRRQTVVTTAPSDLERFSITIAEAINGLRASAPRTAAPAEPAPRALEPPETRDSGSKHGAQATSRPHALALELALLVDLEQPEPLLGTSVRSELPLGRSFRVLLESLVTLTPLSPSEGDTVLAAHFAWTRLGLSHELMTEPASIGLSLSAGPALTWVDARTTAPRVARADVAVSALFSLRGSVVYPSHSSVFASAALGASTLVPQIRFQLPSGPTEPFGRLLFEGALGFGARWF